MNPIYLHLNADDPSSEPSNDNPTPAVIGDLDTREPVRKEDVEPLVLSLI